MVSMAMLCLVCWNFPAFAVGSGGGGGGGGHAGGGGGGHSGGERGGGRGAGISGDRGGDVQIVRSETGSIAGKSARLLTVQTKIPPSKKRNVEDAGWYAYQYKGFTYHCIDRGFDENMDMTCFRIAGD
jgi:hypothetical protein